MKSLIFYRFSIKSCGYSISSSLQNGSGSVLKNWISWISIESKFNMKIRTPYVVDNKDYLFIRRILYEVVDTQNMCVLVSPPLCPAILRIYRDTWVGSDNWAFMSKKHAYLCVLNVT